jgi:hypothetical protein
MVKYDFLIIGFRGFCAQEFSTKLSETSMSDVFLTEIENLSEMGGGGGG